LTWLSSIRPDVVGANDLGPSGGFAPDLLIEPLRPAGARIPNQLSMTTPSTPASAKVGRSGSSGSRSADTAAIGRREPARMCGTIEGRLSKNTSIRTPIRSVIAGALPR
jgi:hypothetical protein